MKRLGIFAALLATLCVVPSVASAQVKGVYWTTSGFFGPFNIQGLIPSIPKEKARDVTIPVSMWIIDHPKGLVVFERVGGGEPIVARGQIQSDGTYELSTHKPGDGVPPGKYKVLLNSMDLSDVPDEA